MRDWVVRNGDWYLSAGPDWAVSTWVMSAQHATRFEEDTADEIAREAREQGHRPFGEPPEGARVERIAHVCDDCGAFAPTGRDTCPACDALELRQQDPLEHR